MYFIDSFLYLFHVARKAWLGAAGRLWGAAGCLAILTALPAAAATPASPPPVSHARDVIVCPARRRSPAVEARDAFLDDALHVQFFKTPP